MHPLEIPAGDSVAVLALALTPWLRSHPSVASLAVGTTAGFVVGLLGGGIAVAIGSTFASVRVPFGVVAARAFGTAYERVTGWQRFLAGWAGAVAVATGAGLLVGVAGPLVGLVLRQSTLPVVAAEFVLGVGLVLTVGWWVVAVRWRSLAPPDAPGVARTRRSWRCCLSSTARSRPSDSLRCSRSCRWWSSGRDRSAAEARSFDARSER